MTQNVSSLQHLVDLACKGDRASLARIISKIESRTSEAQTLTELLFPKTGKAQVWGFTGPPGAGKSTVVDQVIADLRKKNKQVAVVAVDPSSPFSGGAILGDRIRMQKHSSDAGVYIRSLGTRGRHGGLSHATKEVVLALDAVGFDVILVETAGVGQTELDILRLAQTVSVILVPESGDSIQVMKAGLMEIADIFCVNKSDRPEADKLVKELMQMVGLNHRTNYVIPVLKTEATKNIGIHELVDAAEKHQTFLHESDTLKDKQKLFLKEELLDVLTEQLKHSFESMLQTPSGQQIIQDLVEKKISPYLAAKMFSE